jgi:glycerophosphoryl diester phosphodiesterase
MPLRIRMLVRAARPDGVSLHHALASPAVVRAVHGRGAALIAWTVNEPARIEELAQLGVDAIVTDDPALALQILGR